MFLKWLIQPQKKERKKFDWSLKPLIICMRFASGCNLNISSKFTSKAIRFAVPVMGLFYVMAHLVVNGPCALFSHKARYDEMKSLFKINLMKKEEVSYLAGDVIKISLFFSTTLIHLIFMANVLLTKKWRNVWNILQKIHQEMKLDNVFHGKLRRHCLVVLSLFILVNSIF